MTQGNSIATSVHATFGVSVTMVGVVITVLALLIIIGGIKTISKVSSVVVPVMANFLCSCRNYRHSWKYT